MTIILPTPGEYPWAEKLNAALAGAIDAGSKVDELYAAQASVLEARDDATAAAASATAAVAGLDAEISAQISEQVPPIVQAAVDEAVADIETGGGPSAFVYSSDLVPGGTGNSSAAFQALINLTSSTGKIGFVSPGTYYVDTTITIPANTKLDLTGVTLNFSRCTSSTYMSATGTFDPTVAALTSATKGSYTANTTLPVSENDWVFVRSDDKFDVSSTNISLGEIQRVRSYASGVVTFWTPLRDTYTTTPTIRKMNMLEGIHIKGGTILGNKTIDSGKTAFSITLAAGARIEKLTVKNVDQRHIFFDNSVDCRVDRSTFHWANASLAYGISLNNATRNFVADDCKFTYVRHAFSTNNSSAGFQAGITRDVTLSRSLIEHSSSSTGAAQGTISADAIDSHTAAEGVHILGNTVTSSQGSGINLEAASGSVIGNRITNVGGFGISVHNESDRNGTWTITENVVEGALDDWAIRVAAAGRSGVLGRHVGVVVNNNTVRRCVGGIRVGSTVSAIRDSAVTVTGNTITDCTGNGMALQNMDGVACMGNVIQNVVGKGIAVTDVTDITLGPDTIRVTDSRTITALDLRTVRFARVQPGAIRATFGVLINVACEDMSVGHTSHIAATTPVSNSSTTRITLEA